MIDTENYTHFIEETRIMGKRIMACPMMMNNGDIFPQNVAGEVFYQPGLINFSNWFDKQEQRTKN